jgi:hypothetical protein
MVQVVDGVPSGHADINEITYLLGQQRLDWLIACPKLFNIFPNISGFFENRFKLYMDITHLDVSF